MEGSVEISDRILINRFYNLLYNEYDEYRDIFNEIGIDLGLATGEIRDEQVEKINVWIEGLDSNRVQDDEKIKLIELLEKFRKISDKDDEFDNQLEIVKDIYEIIFGVIATKKMDYSLGSFNKYFYDYFLRTQEHALKISDYRRDNIIHQLRVFLLGIYILYDDKEFWRKRFREDIRAIIGEEKFKVLLTGIETSDLIGDIRLIEFKDVLIAWMLTSLYHDFGRPIEDAVKATKDINRIYDLGLSVKKTYLFGIDVKRVKKIEDSLNQCVISEELRDIFKTKGFSPSKDSSTRSEEERKWKITDREDIYTILKENGTLNIYKETLLSKAEDAMKELISFLKRYVSDERILGIIENKAKDFNHGPMSLLACSFLSPGRISKQGRNAIIGQANPSAIALIIESSVAIALHSDIKCIFSTLLTQFLILCDELQEWNRVTALGDQNVRIFPCRKIYLNIGTIDGIKNIRAVIPYEEPKDIVGQELFSRFKPILKWKNSKNKLETAKQFTFDRSRGHNQRIKLEFHIVPNLKILGDIITIRIDEDKLVKSEDANMGDILFSWVNSLG